MNMEPIKPIWARFYGGTLSGKTIPFHELDASIIVGRQKRHFNDWLNEWIPRAELEGLPIVQGYSAPQYETRLIARYESIE